MPFAIGGKNRVIQIANLIRRRRKLLVSKKELARLWNATQRKGMTLVPLVLYFNHKGLVKMKIGIANNKNQ